MENVVSSACREFNNFIVFTVWDKSVLLTDFLFFYGVIVESGVRI
ncbi:hypothetical protein PUATCC27989T_00372 [Phytobacter ursingii]|nr:hypothetical protein PUATCC27989T_00372 [Phytobacter ursingii]